MDKTTENTRTSLLQRGIALGLAFATTSFIATSVAVIFTGSGAGVMPALAGLARIPLRALSGG